MTQHLTKLLIPALFLLLGSPVGATPNVEREAQLEAEEHLQMVGASLQPAERSLLDRFNTPCDEFYGCGVVYAPFTW